MDELVAYVKTQVPETAPDSSSRIMRDLRQKGKLRYTLVSRRDSRYRIDP
jgi:hypothetical protein